MTPALSSGHVLFCWKCFDKKAGSPPPSREAGRAAEGGVDRRYDAREEHPEGRDPEAARVRKPARTPTHRSRSRRDAVTGDDDGDVVLATAIRGQADEGLAGLAGRDLATHLGRDRRVIDHLGQAVGAEQQSIAVGQSESPDIERPRTYRAGDAGGRLPLSVPGFGRRACSFGVRTRSPFRPGSFRTSWPPRSGGCRAV